MEFLDWWYGLLGLSIPTVAIYILVTTHVTFIAITVYLHRFSAHRAMTMHPALQHVMRFWVWFTTGMGTKSWTAVHRKHHALTETEGDPHSPKVKGLWTILFKGVEAYRDAITPDTLEKYGKGTPDDWLENNIYDQDKLGVGMLLVIDLLLFGSVGLVVWGIQMIWVPFFAAGVINGVGHAIGYRNFECPDASKNIVPIAFFICGEELHNNHHTYPNSPKLSVKKWEFDLGWGYIKLFEFFGLCKPNKVGPVIEKDKTKSAIDFDTLRALANDRFAVMSKFANQVVSPVVSSLSSENGNSRKLLQKAKRAICRDPIVMDQKMSQYQEQLFKQFPVLAEIYRHKEELLKVWSKRTGRKEELLKAFGNWCEASEKIAERWRLEHLSKFVDELKSYSVPKLTSA